MFVFGNDRFYVAIWIVQLHIDYMLLVDSWHLNSPRRVTIKISYVSRSPKTFPGPNVLLSNLYSIIAIQVRHDQLFQWLRACRYHNHLLVREVWRVWQSPWSPICHRLIVWRLFSRLWDIVVVNKVCIRLWKVILFGPFLMCEVVRMIDNYIGIWPPMALNPGALFRLLLWIRIFLILKVWNIRERTFSSIWIFENLLVLVS